MAVSSRQSKFLKESRDNLGTFGWCEEEEKERRGAWRHGTSGASVRVFVRSPKSSSDVILVQTPKEDLASDYI